MGSVSGRVLVCEGGCQLAPAWWGPAGVAGRWRGHPGGLPARRRGHVSSHQHLPSVPQWEGLRGPLWPLSLVWGTHFAPPTCLQGATATETACPLPGEARLTCGLLMDSCTLHRRTWHCRPGWGHSRLRARAQLGRGLGPGPVWDLYNKAFLFHELESIPGTTSAMPIDLL